ncbi:MAG: class II glutamine amidotransferase [Deltaproteobacteria bacterium]|nr:class II glutamine amidotransferase [Deltaproteobacteria bacterium]
MPNMIAMSFEGMLAPSFELRGLTEGHLPDGWGVGFYGGAEPAATILKEHSPRAGSLRSELIKTWDHLSSSTFLLHIRRARWGSISDANTQPFVRTWGGRDWMFAHAGSLDTVPPVEGPMMFEPVGSTDSELVFCILMNRIAERGWRSLGEVDIDETLALLRDMDGYGSFSVVLCDGRDLLAYTDGQGKAPLYAWERRPPYNSRPFGDEDLVVDLFKRGITSRNGLVLSSELLAQDGGPASWQQLPAGELLIARQGTIRLRTGPQDAAPQLHIYQVPTPPAGVEPKTFRVRHTSVYTYEKPVERSDHLLRLTPIEDHLQRLREHTIEVSVDGRARDFEDVFGNRCRRLLIETPYTELRIVADSVVEVLDSDPFHYRPLRARTQIPLVWMPWQRHMLAPYMLPPELPESQLATLTDYAMNFVGRNSSDLLQTLLDMNITIFKEYTYRQGSTTLATTAFETYVDRQGVCQDFANLLIAMARLLGVPARYATGYIYTGPKAANVAQSEASHAWVQCYLPELGWKGFDPTNGLVTQTDHVRVAVGRNYVDATPTGGTIYVGGAGETLSVDVQFDPIE